jgi:6-pyruvoyltetrahydropterin/6-carboxytetrahydropterin synthase
MFRVTKEIEFCYGHRLLHYDGKCRHPHGHNGRCEIELFAERLDKRGMVFDFEDIKKTVQTWIDNELDHKMLLNKEDPYVEVFQKLGEPVFLVEGNPTAENIAKTIYDYEVRLWETPHSFAAYKKP